MIKTSDWKTVYVNHVESIKDITYTETDRRKLRDLDTNLVTGAREGTNKFG